MKSEYANSCKWSRNNLISPYKQLDNVCLIASFSFLLEYAQCNEENRNEVNTINILSMCTSFLKDKNILTNINCFQPDEIKANQKEKEHYISDVFHCSCGCDGNVSGYKYLSDFLEYLKHNKFYCANNMKLIIRKPNDTEDRKHIINNAYNDIADYLSKNTEENNVGYAALILYKVDKKNSHSVFLGYDGEFFFRDGNSNGVTKSTSHDVEFTPDVKINEYMIFEIDKT